MTRNSEDQNLKDRESGIVITKGVNGELSTVNGRGKRKGSLVLTMRRFFSLLLYSAALRDLCGAKVLFPDFPDA